MNIANESTRDRLPIVNDERRPPIESLQLSPNQFANVDDDATRKQSLHKQTNK